MKSFRIIPNYGDSNFITGMRAFAALAVFLIHSGGGGLREFGPVANFFVSLGKTGVYAFFVISGFSVSFSIERSKSYLEFFIKRMMRLAPLYYFFLLLSLLVGVTSTWGTTLAMPADFYTYFMHFTFLSAFDYRVANNILGVEWSLAIEVFWYLLIPFMIRFTTNWKKSLGAILFCVILYKVSRFSFDHSSINKPGLAFLWTPFRYGICFLLGIFAYRLRPRIQTILSSIQKNALSMFLFGCFALYLFFPFAKDIYFISIFTFGLILIGGKGNIITRIIFENKPALYIGAISYSFYLVHYPVLFLYKKYWVQSTSEIANFSIPLAVSIIISSITYLMIEKNSMKATRKVVGLLIKE